MRHNASTIILTATLAAFCASVAPAQQEKGNMEVGLSGSLTIPHVAPGAGTTGLIAPRFGYFLGKKHYIGVDNTILLANGFQMYDFAFLYRYYLSARTPRFFPFVGVAPGVAITSEPTTLSYAVTDASITAFAAQVARLPAAQQSTVIASANDVVRRFYEVNKPKDIKRSAFNETGRAQLGFKSYLSKKFAFEVAYNLLYRNVRVVAGETAYSDLVLASGNAVRLQAAATANIPKLAPPSPSFKDRTSSAFTFGFSYIF